MARAKIWHCLIKSSYFYPSHILSVSVPSSNQYIRLKGNNNQTHTYFQIYNIGRILPFNKQVFELSLSTLHNMTYSVLMTNLIREGQKYITTWPAQGPLRNNNRNGKIKGLEYRGLYGGDFEEGTCLDDVTCIIYLLRGRRSRFRITKIQNDGRSQKLWIVVELSY